MRKCRPLLFLFQTKVWNNLLVKDSVQCLQSKGASSRWDSGPCLYFLGKQLHLKDIVEVGSVAHKSCCLQTVITEVFSVLLILPELVFVSLSLCISLSLYVKCYLKQCFSSPSFFFFLFNVTFTCLLPLLSLEKLTLGVVRQG